MYFKQFLHDSTGCASYFIASRRSREAVVVDPQHDVQPYVELAADRDYSIRHVIDTHIHADHVSGNRRLAQLAGAELWLPAKADVAFAYQALNEDDQLQVGQIRLRVLQTPGHRPEAICLLVTNLERSSEPALVLSGDTLFVGDVGRPDFGGPHGAADQYRSTRRLLALPDWVEVFPAHFEGACGRSMCGRPSSTIGFERRFNPMLQHEESEFVQLVTEPTPRPLNMIAVVATNRGVADYGSLRPNGTSRVDSVAADWAPKWIAERQACVLDVREPWEFGAGHIQHAVCMPQADLAIELQCFDRERSLLVVCESGFRSARAAAFLKSRGFNRIANLSGGMLAWRRAGNRVLT
ncbi:MAG: MBL fold metallo-hydrolase [Chloroflexi bacterium]|nr:MBL fold metallo-hydrolase [Chloroflexota bacterium]